MINFEAPILVTNLFCGPLGMPVILRPSWNACYFAALLECLLFCGPLGMPVILLLFVFDLLMKAKFEIQILALV
ncbi:MAG: hypothetical protein DRR16_09180 [Candidatus Parabeggiatoa sp. nov. 3]|nr:MAG: hypothetical protein DRR16_09180 [Gammaproteobacteria bacterium]